MESIHAGQEQFDQAAAICKLKKAIRPNPEEINAAWTRLLAAIEREAKVIKEKGPDVSFRHFEIRSINNNSDNGR